VREDTLKDAWREITEETIKANVQYIKACAKSQGWNAGFMKIGEAGEVYGSWARFKTFLKKLGFDPEAKHQWEIAGVPKMEGKETSREMLNTRLRQFKLLCSAAEGAAGWSGADKEAMAAAGHAMTKAVKQCEKEVEHVSKARSNAEGGGMPKFLEPPQELEEWISRKVLEKGERPLSILGLSNVRGQWTGKGKKEDNEREGKMGHEKAREFMEELCGGEKSADKLLPRFQGRTLIVWAPRGQRQANIAFGAVHRALTEGRLDLKVVWCCLREAVPDCKDAELLQDVWSHALTGREWADTVREVCHLEEPGIMVCTQNGAPASHAKSFSIITMSEEGGRRTSRMASWSDTLLEENAHIAIWIDTREEDSVKTQRALGAIKGGAITHWEGPVRSPGSTSQEARIRFRAFMNREGTSALEADRMVRTLISRLPGSRTLVGQQDMIRDARALVVESTCPQVLPLIKDLCKGIVTISPKIALIYTAQEKGVWEDKITELVRLDPAVAVKQVKWRSYCNDGEIWVRPQQLDTRVQGAMATSSKRKAGKDEEEGTVILTLPGDLGATPNRVIEKLMERVGECIGTPMEEVQGESEPQEDQWHKVPGPRGRRGMRIKLVTRDAESAARVCETIQGKSVIINGIPSAVQATCAFLEDESLAREEPPRSRNAGQGGQ